MPCVRENRQWHATALARVTANECGMPDPERSEASQLPGMN